MRTSSDCGAGGVSQHTAMRDRGERLDTGVRGCVPLFFLWSVHYRTPKRCMRTSSDCGAGGVSQHVAMRDRGERTRYGCAVRASVLSLERALPDA